jgi:formylglycine-generating enzyme required for sulfatase activity
MTGNVFEWTCTDYNNRDRISKFDMVDNQSSVSIRGGAWESRWKDARCACIYSVNPHNRNNTLGLRLVAE